MSLRSRLPRREREKGAEARPRRARTVAGPVEEAAARAPARSAGGHETFERRLRQRAAEAWFETVRAGLPGLRQVEGDSRLVQHGERADRPAVCERGVIDRFDRDPLRRHGDGFVQIGGEHPGREEAWAVPHDDRPLASATDKRQRPADDGVGWCGVRPRPRPEACGSAGEKKCSPRKRDGSAKACASPPMASPDVVAGEDRLGRGPLDLRQEGVLDCSVFRRAFNHEIAALQAAIDPGDDSTWRESPPLRRGRAGRGRPARRATPRGSRARAAKPLRRARRERPRRPRRQKPARSRAPSGPARPRRRERKSQRWNWTASSSEARPTRAALAFTFGSSYPNDTPNSSF